MLPYIIAGLTTGSIYGLAAIGLVLTYRTSGIFNFAHGALASVSAFLFYFLADQHRIAWPIAAGICVLVGGPVIGVVMEQVTRRVNNASLSIKVLATVGILLTIQGGIDLLYPESGAARAVAQFLPGGGFSISGTPVATSSVITFAVGVASVVGLTAFLRVSSAGLAMRGVVDNSELLDVMGTSPARTRRLAWMIGAMMAAASGVLIAPLIPLQPESITFLVVTAFGAAAIGRFTNLPVTYLGALAIGVAQALLQKEFLNSTGLGAGLGPSLPFVILFAVLVAGPRVRALVPAEVPRRSNMRAWQAPWNVRLGGVMLLGLVLIFVPSFAGLHILDWTEMLAYVILFLSLGLLVRMSGQVSLGQVSFMAIGVSAFSDVAYQHHWPWLLALLFAAAVAAPIGALLAIPAIRFPGIYLALATLGFGLLLQNMFYSQSYMFGSGYGTPVPRPTLGWLDLSSNTGYYYVVLAAAALVATGIYALEKSRLGRLLRAMADSPAGLEASGASISLTRVMVFSLSASLAAVSGVLAGGAVTIVGSTGYDPLLSIQVFALLMISVGASPWYAVLAAAGQVLIPSYIASSATVADAFTLLFGVGAIIMSVTSPQSRRLPYAVIKVIDGLGLDEPKIFRRARRATTLAHAHELPDASHEAGLAVEGLTIRFGGLVAVDGISVHAQAGSITGLIGPNGAGKTTVFNACSGLVSPSSGVIRLGSADLRRLGPAKRARLGLGRTFQHMELFDSLSVRENVAIGSEAAFAGWNPLDHLLARRRQRTSTRKRTDEALALCGLDQLAGNNVGALSTGQRRLVELARCVSGDYDILLLDEPSSGLDRTETDRFGQILRRVVSERRVGILLIEHDMTLINSLCDFVYVMDFGKPIFQGTVGEVGASALVRSAYLGEEGAQRTLTSVDLGGASA